MSTTKNLARPCSICYKVLEPEQQICQPCQYLSCSECLVEWTLIKIKELQCGPEETIPCMAGCGDLFAVQSVFQCLSANENARINEALFQVYLNKQLDVRKCPKKGCPYAGVAELNSNCTEPLNCEICETKWRDNQHSTNYESLNDLARRLTIRKNELFSAIWKSIWAKKCPKCSMVIEKSGGCEHMTCKKCKYEFCWTCSVQHPRHNTLLHSALFLMNLAKILLAVVALVTFVYFSCQLLYSIPFIGTLCDMTIIPLIIMVKDLLMMILRGVWWFWVLVWKFVLTNMMIMLGVSSLKINEKERKIVCLIVLTICLALIICFGGFNSMIKILCIELTIYLTVTWGRYLYKGIKTFIRDTDLDLRIKSFVKQQKSKGPVMLVYGQDSIAYE